jgi:hypothetical protein
MSERQSFVLYYGQWQPIKDLSFEQKGIILDAIFTYQMTKKPVILTDKICQIAFNFIKNQMDLDANKYEEMIAKRKLSGKKGGLAKASNAKQTVAKSSKPYLNDNVNVNVNDNVNDISITQIMFEFQEFWKIYDRKQRKDAAIKLWKKMKATERLSALEKVHAYVASRPDKQYRLTPDKWLRQKCWEDEILTPESKAPANTIEASFEKELEQGQDAANDYFKQLGVQ